MSSCYSPSELESQTFDSFTHTISLEDYITRILILGSKNNKYSSSSKGVDECTKKYIQEQIVAGNGQRILDVLRKIYIAGRAPKQDATFMLHAMLCKADDIVLRKSALEFIKEYRTISQIYSWKNIHAKTPNSAGSKTKGFGRAVKRELNNWILAKTPDQLGYQVTKYMSRGEWGLKDLLKCIHTKTGSGDDRVFKDKAGIDKPIKMKHNRPASETDLILRFIVDGVEKMTELASKYNLLESKTYKYLKAVACCKTMTDLGNPLELDLLLYSIRHFRLNREQVPTEALALLPVQLALLTNEDHTKITMPMTALLRNLANLTRLGLFADAHILELVVTHLKNVEVITKARIHPVHVLTAWFTYRKGHGKMSKHNWVPNVDIIRALEEMFYFSFKNVRPTGKRLCFLIDCSGSMSSDSLCEGVTNAEIAALLAMVFSRAEANVDKLGDAMPVSHSFYLFTSGKRNEGLMDVSDIIHAKASFKEVLTAVQRSDWASTNISKGIVQAMKFRRLYDGFVVLTDNDVNSGIKPSIALQQYRRALGVQAKLAVVATQLTDISIADPLDKGMMDFCGFDSNGPKILQDFFSGSITEPLLEADAIVDVDVDE